MNYNDWKNKLIIHQKCMYAHKMKQFGINMVSNNDILAKRLIENNIYGVNNINIINESYLNREPLGIIVGFGGNVKLHIGHLIIANELLFYLRNFKDVKIYFVNLEVDYCDTFVKKMYEILKNNYNEDIYYEIIDFNNLQMLKLKKEIMENLNLKTINRVMGWEDKNFYDYSKVINMITTFYINNIVKEKNSIVISDINQVTFYGIAKNLEKKVKLQLPAFSYHILLPSLKNPQERMSINSPKSLIYLDENKTNIIKKLNSAYTGSENKVMTCSYLKILDLIYEPSIVGDKIKNCLSSSSMCSQCKSCTLNDAAQKIVLKKLK